VRNAVGAVRGVGVSPLLETRDADSSSHAVPPVVLALVDGADYRAPLGDLGQDNDVIWAAAGAGALAALHAHRPDVVVVELRSLEEGRHLIRDLRADETVQDAAVIFLTEAFATDVRAALLAEGADDCMSRPFNSTELRMRVRNLVRAGQRFRLLRERNRTLEAEVRGHVPGEMSGPVFRREGDYWTVLHHGRVFRLRDSKGLRHLSHLLERPADQVHVLALCVPCDEGRPVQKLGDAGLILDATAKTSYRRRLEDLKELLEDARRAGDPIRTSRIEDEMHAIASELARAVGLHGRDRRAASIAERARINVTRTIKAAIGSIAVHDRALAKHLDASVRTGTFCSYYPAPASPGPWRLG
jgi:CheY-like chemotaxis protein